MPGSVGARFHEASNWPEFNVAVFAVLLNLPWEFFQVPFFRR